MKGYVENIEKLTLANKNFRAVLYTAPHSQLVLMSLKPAEEIGEEVHQDSDQFFRFESGQGKAVLNGVEHPLKDGDVVIVPAGMQHNIINTSNSEDLKMYTLYSPAHHRDGVVHATKLQAEADDEKFNGKFTE